MGARASSNLASERTRAPDNERESGGGAVALTAGISSYPRQTAQERTWVRRQAGSAWVARVPGRQMHKDADSPDGIPRDRRPPARRWQARDGSSAVVVS